MLFDAYPQLGGEKKKALWTNKKGKGYVDQRVRKLTMMKKKKICK